MIIWQFFVEIALLTSVYCSIPTFTAFPIITKPTFQSCACRIVTSIGIPIRFQICTKIACFTSCCCNCTITTSSYTIFGACVCHAFTCPPGQSLACRIITAVSGPIWFSLVRWAEAILSKVTRLFSYDYKLISTYSRAFICSACPPRQSYTFLIVTPLC